MMHNRIRPEDQVKIEICFDGKEIDSFSGSGFHTIEDAVDTAYSESKHCDLDKRDYVYTVENITDGTSARYRFNAHDNLKILPEL